MTADLLFPRAHVAVFLDGCFWHGCPDHFRLPRTNADYWLRRIGANVRRVPAVADALARSGWTAIRVWEHEDPTEAASRVANAVEVSLLRVRKTAVCGLAPVRLIEHLVELRQTVDTLWTESRGEPPRLATTRSAVFLDDIRRQA